MAFEPDNRTKNEIKKFIDDGSGNPALRTLTTITADLNVDNNSTSTEGLIGKKSGNADFTTTVVSATAFTCAALPTGITNISADDIVSVVQISNSNGVVSATYTRDDNAMTAVGTDPTTLTVEDASFATGDRIVVYTNIGRDQAAGSVTSATPRTTLASDDPAVTALQIMDDWDGVDGAAIGTDGAVVMFKATSTQQATTTAGYATTPVVNLFREQINAGYDYATNANRVEETDPISSHHVEETLASVTNGTDGIYYYYFDMDGFQYFTNQLTLAPGGGIITSTFEATVQDDGTAPASCTFVDVTTSLFGVATFTASDMAIVDTPVGFKYVRLKVYAGTGGANTADWTSYNKKWY